MVEDKLPEWERMERKVCKKEHMKHVGGSGNPDCVDPENPNRIVEVKTYNRPFNSHDLKTVIKKDWAKEKDLTINVINSCTNNAKELAEKIPNLILKCNVKNHLSAGS